MVEPTHMIRQYGFEKLGVWQKSRQLVKDIYGLVKALPAEEKFGLISQIQRAVVSVSSNIAEGASRTSSKDQGHFYQTAYSSLMEVLCQLTLCLDLDYISEAMYCASREKIDLIAYQINQLRTAVLSNPPQSSQNRGTQLPKPSKLSKPD